MEKNSHVFASSLTAGKQHKACELDMITLRNHALRSYKTRLPLTLSVLDVLLYNLQLWRHRRWFRKFTVRFWPIRKERVKCTITKIISIAQLVDNRLQGWYYGTLYSERVILQFMCVGCGLALHSADEPQQGRNSCQPLRSCFICAETWWDWEGRDYHTLRSRMLLDVRACHSLYILTDLMIDYSK